MALKDPIRVVDRRDLKDADLSRVAAAVQRNVQDMRRAMKDRFGADFDPSALPVPNKEIAAGYVSNVRAYLLNESRRAKETIVDLTTAGATKAMAQSWARSLSFNKGVLDLSVASHPRALQRISVLDFAESAGIDHLAMLVPSHLEASLSPGGMLAKHVGKVRTISEWIAVSKGTNKDRQGLSLIFTLGLHHNDPHQMLPVPSALVAAAVAELRRYREALIARILRWRSP